MHDEDVVCTITNQRKTGFLNVVKTLLPDTHPGRFNLQIDGGTDPDAENASDGGSTGQQEVDTDTQTVGETAYPGTSLDDYEISISCLDQGGQGTQVAASTDVGPLNVDVGRNDDILCTVTNVIQIVPPPAGVDLPAQSIVAGLAIVGIALMVDGF